MRAQDDLKITGVIDQEFSYAGPAQLLATAPWWLLLERPHMWDFSEEMEDRFLRHLDMFKRVLEEEEEATPGHEDKELSRLIERSNENGTLCSSATLQTGMSLRRGIPEEEIQAFVAKKMRHVKLHDKRKEDMLAAYEKLQWCQIDADTFFQVVEGLYGRADDTVE
ncbi:hypothetical protein B0T17DRAFT_618207 [Bombardia bombarda]|uniref:Uncharacterized protein n=1 Tax=Bombardia bombarda TaxID=252184 RepID=A0AA39WUI5_9PEZI|nr:hypothetical protein B0T17DRAFT_618207 [Bombardia bombarda]